MSEIDPHYLAALDEIYRLRVLLAHEAQIQGGHLMYKSFPKSRRDVAEHSIERMRRAARGQSVDATARITHPKAYLRLAGAPDTLTRTEWEARP